MRVVFSVVGSLCLAAVAWAADPIPSVMRLPEGHPQIGNRPATTQAAQTGTLSIRAVQGTSGGGAVGAEAVTVELWHRGQAIQKIDTKLDAQGVAVLKDLPVGTIFQPVVTVNYRGVEYQAVGEVMDPANPEQALEVKVFETTEEAPAWDVKMRHVIVHRAEEGLHVREMLVVHNPADRAWRGTVDAAGQRTSLALPLPAGAQEVQLGDGFHECCTRVEDGRIANGMALVPGTTKFVYAYMLVPTSNPATLPIISPAATAQLMVMVSDETLKVTAQGLEDGGMVKMGQSNSRMLRGSNLPAGHQAAVTFDGLAVVAPLTSGGYTPQIIAGVGVGLLVVLGSVLVLVKKSPKR